VTWLSSIDRQTIDRLITDGECMHLAAGLDGEIYWASEAFCEWSGYLLNELQKTSWVKISVDDESLAADRQACEEMKAGSRTTYQIEKQYIKKDGTRHWGVLHVRRVDKSDGSVHFAWCAWTPLKNGNATAFAKAVDIGRALEKKFDEMTTEIRSVTQRSDEENWTMATVRMAKRHPKVAVGILVILASLLGADAFLGILRSMGLWATPIKVERATYEALRDHQTAMVTGIANAEQNTGRSAASRLRHPSIIRSCDHRCNIVSPRRQFIHAAPCPISTRHNRRNTH